MTTYQEWNDGLISGFGSFHTTLLQAYKNASCANRQYLELSFPEWFVYTAEFTQAEIIELDKIKEAAMEAFFTELRQPKNSQLKTV